MKAMLLGLALLALLPGQQPPGGPTPRKPHPLAPSLPELTDAEEANLDRVIDRFIAYDTGKLKGTEGKQALTEFNQLGPEAIPALIRGLNRAANLEHSCPSVIIRNKLQRLLLRSNDVALLDFARDNIGAGVTASRYKGMLNDLRVSLSMRKASVLRSGTAFVPEPSERESRPLTVKDLARLAGSERGEKLKAVLDELGKRPGDEALAALGSAATSYDGDVQKQARELLQRRLAQLRLPALKDKLKDDRLEVRALAAKVSVERGQRWGGELIELLNDDEPRVRQAARQALVRLSRGQDFGPEANATAAQQAEAVRRWRTWWTAQGNR